MNKGPQQVGSTQIHTPFQMGQSFDNTSNRLPNLDTAKATPLNFDGHLYTVKENTG